MANRPLSIDIRHPLLLKANDLVLLTREDYALRLHDTVPLLLMASDEEGIAAQMELTNHRLSSTNGQPIADQKLGVRRTFLLLDDRPVFIDTLAIRNFGAEQVTLPVSLECAAHVLWTGIATPAHAHRTAQRMLQPDMFSGWGIRTLSADHPAFDPLAYQQGSVWAFDNSLIVSGLRRYDEDDAALRIVAGTLDAARGVRLGRMPEFIAGTQRQRGDKPTHTPRADPLQAWSAASVPFMTSELLGLHADGFARRLHVRRPLLPNHVDRLVLRDMQVAGSSVSLRFTRQDGGIHTEVIGGGAGLDVVVE